MIRLFTTAIVAVGQQSRNAQVVATSACMKISIQLIHAFIVVEIATMSWLEFGEAIIGS